MKIYEAFGPFQFVVWMSVDFDSWRPRWQRWSHRCRPLQLGRPAWREADRKWQRQKRKTCEDSSYCQLAHRSHMIWSHSMWNTFWGWRQDVPVLACSRSSFSRSALNAWGKAICKSWRALPRTTIWCWHGAPHAPRSHHDSEPQVMSALHYTKFFATGLIWFEANHC